MLTISLKAMALFQIVCAVVALHSAAVDFHHTFSDYVTALVLWFALVDGVSASVRSKR